jgi:hypothetical protein
VLIDTNDRGKQTGASLANALAASGKEYLESVYAAEVALQHNRFGGDALASL